MTDDAFSRGTAELLAKRASYLCSNPDCSAQTIGPSEADPKKAKSVGVAAHMTANKPGGPRYDASLSSEQRRDASNGIWLCQTCSRNIDANGGIDHPLAQLRQWKSVHEEKRGKGLGRPAETQYTELAGTIEAHGVGNVVGAELGGPTRIKPGTHVSASGVGNVTGVIVKGKL